MKEKIDDVLRSITEHAAIACYSWIGRGEKELADNSAVEAMRNQMVEKGLSGKIVIGEGEKDNAPMLFKGEVFGGEKSGSSWDIAVDPLEGTTNLAKGLANSMAVMSVCPTGKMWDPGPSFYMNKFVASKEAKGKIDPEAPLKEKLVAVAKSLGKDVSDLRIFILDKPRHKNIIRDLYTLGCRISIHPAGDVAGALLAALPGTDIDILLGTGGTPEGILSACAVKSIGAEMHCRPDPQLSSEIIALREAGISSEKWMETNQIIQSDDVYFCASGITDGDLFDGIRMGDSYVKVESLLLAGVGRERMKVTSFRDSNSNNCK